MHKSEQRKNLWKQLKIMPIASSYEGKNIPQKQSSPHKKTLTDEQISPQQSPKHHRSERDAREKYQQSRENIEFQEKNEPSLSNCNFEDFLDEPILFPSSKNEFNDDLENYEQEIEEEKLFRISILEKLAEARIRVKDMGNEHRSLKEAIQYFKKQFSILLSGLSEKFEQKMRKEQKKWEDKEEKLNKAILQKKIIQNSYLELEIEFNELKQQIEYLREENGRLQESIFEYMQKQAQIQLQVQQKVQNALNQNKSEMNKGRNKYLFEISLLEEEIANLSENYQKINKEKAQLEERQVDLNEREEYLTERQDQVLLKEKEIIIRIDEIAYKEKQVQKIKEKLLMKHEELNVRENSLVTRKRTKQKEKSNQRRMKNQSFLKHQKSEGNLQTFRVSLFGNESERKYYGNLFHSPPRVQKPFPKATKDIDSENFILESEKLKKKNKGNHKRTGSQASKLDYLGQKLNKLRSQIKKEMDAVK